MTLLELNFHQPFLTHLRERNKKQNTLHQGTLQPSALARRNRRNTRHSLSRRDLNLLPSKGLSPNAVGSRKHRPSGKHRETRGIETPKEPRPLPGSVPSTANPSHGLHGADDFKISDGARHTRENKETPTNSLSDSNFTPVSRKISRHGRFTSKKLQGPCGSSDGSDTYNQPFPPVHVHGPSQKFQPSGDDTPSTIAEEENQATMLGPWSLETDVPADVSGQNEDAKATSVPDSTLGYRIVIVGGGCCGLLCAKAISDSVIDDLDVEVVLVEPKQYFEYPPALVHAVTHAATYGQQACVDLAECLPRKVRHMPNRMVSLTADHVLLSDGSGLEYDFLVLATGSLVGTKALGSRRTKSGSGLFSTSVNQDGNAPRAHSPRAFTGWDITQNFQAEGNLSPEQKLALQAIFGHANSVDSLGHKAPPRSTLRRAQSTQHKEANPTRPFLAPATVSSFPTSLAVQATTQRFRQRQLFSVEHDLSRATKVVLAGGGLLAIKLALRIRERWPDASVEIVHKHSALCSRFPGVHEVVSPRLARAGIRVVFEDTLHRVGASKTNYTLTSSPGRIFHADFIFFTVGTSGNSEMLRTCELVEEWSPRNRLTVDIYLRMFGQKNVFVGGDLASFFSSKQEEDELEKPNLTSAFDELSVKAAIRHAAVISRNICHLVNPIAYPNVVKFNPLKYQDNGFWQLTSNIALRLRSRVVGTKGDNVASILECKRSTPTSNDSREEECPCEVQRRELMRLFRKPHVKLAELDVYL